MTNQEKKELRQFCREGLSFKEIKGIVDCADITIRNYMKVFSQSKKERINEKRKSVRKKYHERA